MNWRAMILGAAATLATSAAQARVVCTAIADADTGKLLVEEGDCAREVTPASTFKIAISLMGYDAGVLKDEHDPVMPFKPGYADWRPSWKQPADPTRWMAESVVWYSQQITQTLGAKRFSAYVARFGYGNQDLTGNRGKDDGLTNAWLSSSLKISPLGQLQFLRRLVRRSLPVSPVAYDKTAAITRVAGDFGGWEVHGKTGAGAPRTYRGALDERIAYGWFVGWATRGERRVVFARLEQNTGDAGGEPPSLRAKAGLLRELPGRLAAN